MRGAVCGLLLVATVGAAPLARVHPSGTAGRWVRGAPCGVPTASWIENGDEPRLLSVSPIFVLRKSRGSTVLLFGCSWNFQRAEGFVRGLAATLGDGPDSVPNPCCVGTGIKGTGAGVHRSRVNDVLRLDGGGVEGKEDSWLSDKTARVIRFVALGLHVWGWMAVRSKPYP